MKRWGISATVVWGRPMTFPLAATFRIPEVTRSEMFGNHVAFQFANTPIILTMPSTIGSKVSPVQSTSKVPRMSFKCFSLAMSIISIKSFVEENRIIKKQNAILKKLQEVFGQVGILLKQWKDRLNDIRRKQRSYSADGEYDKPDRGTTGTYKGDVFAFPFNILPSRVVFFL